MVVTTLASGFALAVQPVAAETITTDTNGLTAGEVKVPVREGTIPAYRAMPDRDAPFPTVLVVQEIFGVHEHIRDLCRRLAKLGYFAVAPELFARQGDVSKLSSVEQILPIVAKVPDSQVMSDLDATALWARGTGKADTTHLALTGFCWGGRIAWLYAAHNPHLRAAAAWYGPVNPAGTELQPQQPLELAGELKAPVLGLYAGKDQGISQEDVRKMRVALHAAHKPSRIVLFAEAQHGFNADYRPSYSEAAARQGWKDMLAWFAHHGVAPKRVGL